MQRGWSCDWPWKPGSAKSGWSSTLLPSAKLRKMCCKVRPGFAKPPFRNGLIGSIPISSASNNAGLIQWKNISLPTKMSGVRASHPAPTNGSVCRLASNQEKANGYMQVRPLSDPPSFVSVDVEKVQSARLYERTVQARPNDSYSSINYHYVPLYRAP